jgi:hypothetical protein
MRTISEVTIKKVFRYGTHEQLENSIKRWLKTGIAVKTRGKYYRFIPENAIELEINVRGKYGTPTWKANACVTPYKDGGFTLLDGTV